MIGEVQRVIALGLPMMVIDVNDWHYKWERLEFNICNVVINNKSVYQNNQHQTKTTRAFKHQLRRHKQPFKIILVAFRTWRPI